MSLFSYENLFAGEFEEDPVFESEEEEEDQELDEEEEEFPDFASEFFDLVEDELGDIDEAYTKRVSSDGKVSRVRDRKTRRRRANKTTGRSKQQRKRSARKASRTKKRNPGTQRKALRKRRKTLRKRKQRGLS